MDPFVVSIVLVSALLHALRDFCTKRSIDKQIFTWCFQMISFVLYIPFFVWLLQTHGLTWTQEGLIALALSSFVHTIYWLFLSRALEHGDLSHVYPIVRSSPAPVLLFSILILGEQVSTQGVIGILIVAMGVYIINLPTLSLRRFFEPITSVRHEVAVRYAFLTLLCVTAYSIIDKYGVNQMHPIQFAFLFVMIEQPFVAWYILSQKSKDAIRTEWKENKLSIVFSGFIVQTGYLLILYAFTLERASHVVALRQSSVIFAVILGTLFLREKGKGPRLLAAAIIFIGSWLIATAQ